MISVDELVTELRGHLGVDEFDDVGTQVSCLLLLNRSFKELLNKFNFRETEGSETLALVLGQAEYPCNIDLDAIHTIAIDDLITGMRKQVDRATVEFYNNNFVNNELAYTCPTHYFRENRKIIFYPTPEQAYNVTIKKWITLQDLASGVIPAVPEVWHEIILLGAVWRGFLKMGDYNRCTAARNHHAALINTTVPVESKEETDSRHAGLEVFGLTRDY